MKKKKNLCQSLPIVVAIMLMALPHAAFAQDVQPGEEHFYLMGEPFKFDVNSNYLLSQAEFDFDSPLLLAQAATGSTESDTAAGASEAEDMAAIAEALANPLSYLWLMFTQNDTKWFDGDLLDRLDDE